MSLKFYYINNDYIDALHNIEPKVYPSTKAGRPYIGIVLKIHDIHYFAPMTSPKEKHSKLRRPVVYKVNSLSDPNDKLGVIQINNMIPVPLSKLTEVVFNDIRDVQYKKLLQKQYIVLKVNRKEIEDTAEELYLKAKAGHPLHRVCNDFRKLEEYYNSLFPLQES
ncbi:type III toxin-antitoxin system ToxN/AbiQ family toxin [Acinetobacter soli]|uniref:type III toxin-antitoxin system ToxN/AbiQ family toxin n=1 Tax=Acinetobacter soli TaxID=487316 RepID=UPI003A8AFE20